jgi:hypothetical protein
MYGKDKQLRTVKGLLWFVFTPSARLAPLADIKCSTPFGVIGIFTGF